MVPQQEVCKPVEGLSILETYTIPVTGPSINLNTKQVPNKYLTEVLF